MKDAKSVAIQAQAPLPLAEPVEAVSLMQVIANAASDPQCDVAKMRALLDMRRELERDEAARLFNEQMNEVQKKIKPIAADAENPSTKSRYASYQALDNALRPIYAEHGFSVDFDTEESQKEDLIIVICTISHRAGHEKRHKAPIPITTTGPKGNPVMTPIHATGSAIQYGRRYTLGMGFNIVVNTDDDGNAAGALKISDDEVKDFRKLVDDFEADEAKLCAHVKAECVEDMTPAQLKKATTTVNAWARKHRQSQPETDDA